MKYYISHLFVSFFLFVMISACSDLEDNITPPPKVGVHPEGTLNANSSNFHGKLLIGGEFETCQQCHAADLSGGITGVSCSSTNCHPSIGVHKEGVKDINSQNFHGKYIMAHDWNLSNCQQCHAADYSGGILAANCNTCHINQGGPEACNTCHGSFADADLIAPPTDLDGNVNTSAPGVGAHSSHLFQPALMDSIACNECHTVPQQFSSTDHIDGTPNAELNFGTLASSGPSAPTHDFTDYTCSNVYCHGNFEFSKDSSAYQFAYEADKMEGNNFSPIWNKVDGTQGTCGTCHGLPPTGHIAATIATCYTCHPGVVNASGEIIDNTKHINGDKNVFGN